MSKNYTDKRGRTDAISPWHPFVVMLPGQRAAVQQEEARRREEEVEDSIFATAWRTFRQRQVTKGRVRGRRKGGGAERSLEGDVKVI